MTISPAGAFPTYHPPRPEMFHVEQNDRIGEWLNIAQGVIVLAFAFIVVLIAMNAAISLVLAATCYLFSY